MLIKNLIARIATPNNKTNSYPPHKRTVTAIEKPYKTAYKNIKNLTVRITTLNNDTNLTPPHGVSFLTDEPVQGGYKLLADTEVVEYSVYYSFAYSLAGQLQDAGDCILKGNCNCIVGHSHF